ncbi:hypothetical protein C8R44DRAFT_816501 [Mycena epipterygia]|nr:hypothetical protein C8R44DRAFT_816501 [Mycena epipterygia]
MGTAVNDAYVRIRLVEEIAGSITSLTIIVVQLDTTFQAVLCQLSASSGTAPPAMSGDDAALIKAALKPNGKRAHEEDDDSMKRQHLDTGVTLPDSFVPPPPGPVFASPAFAPAAVASPTVFVLPTSPPARVYAATAPASVAPIAPGPRIRPDPTREVQFGPMDWVGNYHHFPRNPISNVLKKTMRFVRYTSRRDRMTLSPSSSSTPTLSRPGSSTRGTIPLALGMSAASRSPLLLLLYILCLRTLLVTDLVLS